MRLAAYVTAAIVSAALALDAQAPPAGQPPPGQPTPGQPVRPQTPARDRAITKGTALIRGQVVDAASGAPIRRARVGIFSGREPLAAQTDGEGRFELREVPSGRHSLNVNKAGYLSLFASNNNKPVPPIEIKDGEVIERLVVRLTRGGVVSGQLLDEFGDPFVGAEVRAMRYRYINGQRRLAPAGGFAMMTGTDDLGSFRLFGLEPGDYYVVARGGRDFSAFAGGVAPGDGPAPTYYPGTSNLAEARRVTVRAGRETQGITFSIALARLSRIRGRVATASGEPFKGSISVVTDGDGFSNYGSGVRPDGTFEVSNLPPGTYTLIARGNEYPPNADSESGRVLVSVNGDEVSDVVIATGRGGSARGRIVTDDGSPASAIGSGFEIFPQPADTTAPFFPRGPAKINPDGSFEVTGLFDRVFLRSSVTSTPPSSNTGTSGAGAWTVRSVLVDGQDITDTGLEVRPGQVVDNVQIVYTRRVSRVSGLLKNGRGENAHGWIVVFSADESKWTPQSRFVRVSRPEPDGRYRMTLTPHDNYLMIGVDGIEDGQWQDPEFLRVAKELATRFAIGENESKTQDLTLVEWRR